MKHRLTTVLPLLVVLAAPAWPAGAEEASAKGNVTSLQRFFFRDVIAAAEQVDADEYGFRATDEVRTYGELLAHIVRGSYGLCSIARGVEPPADSRTIEDRAGELGKAGLVRELEAAREYCEETFAEVDAATTSERGTSVLSEALFEGKPVTTAAVLVFQVVHLADHWGNVAVYLRLMGEVPPSTARAQAAREAAGS